MDETRPDGVVHTRTRTTCSRNRADRAASANLEEAAVCVAIECLARESSRRGGERLALRGLPSSPARAGAAG